MLKIIKYELIYFLIIVLVLALFQHSDLLHSPLIRVNSMIEKGNYLHPLLWASVVYIVVGLIRLIAKYVLFIKNRKKAS